MNGHSWRNGNVQNFLTGCLSQLFSIESVRFQKSVYRFGNEKRGQSLASKTQFYWGFERLWAGRVGNEGVDGIGRVDGDFGSEGALCDYGELTLRR